MECTGTFNTVDLSRVVTLSGAQFIPGTTTFKHLEVTETLEVYRRIAHFFALSITHELDSKLSFVSLFFVYLFQDGSECNNIWPSS